MIAKFAEVSMPYADRRCLPVQRLGQRDQTCRPTAITYTPHERRCDGGVEEIRGQAIKQELRSTYTRTQVIRENGKMASLQVKT